MPDVIEVKQPPTQATKTRTTTIAVGGTVSTAVLTLVVAYIFLLYADAHPGFKTPVVAMGPEVGAAIYGGIAGFLTAVWQGLASWIMRGTQLILAENENEGA